MSNHVSLPDLGPSNTFSSHSEENLRSLPWPRGPLRYHHSHPVRSHFLPLSINHASPVAQASFLSLERGKCQAWHLLPLLPGMLPGLLRPRCLQGSRMHSLTSQVSAQMHLFGEAFS